jgi:hypothetical protein
MPDHGDNCGREHKADPGHDPNEEGVAVPPTDQAAPETEQNTENAPPAGSGQESFKKIISDHGTSQ